MKYLACTNFILSVRIKAKRMVFSPGLKSSFECHKWGRQKRKHTKNFSNNISFYFSLPKTNFFSKIKKKIPNLYRVTKNSIDLISKALPVKSFKLLSDIFIYVLALNEFFSVVGAKKIRYRSPGTPAFSMWANSSNSCFVLLIFHIKFVLGK